MKKIIATLLALTSIATMFVGCSSSSDKVNSALPVTYSKLETIDTEYFGETTYEGLSINYDTHVWVEEDLGFGTFTLLKRSISADGGVANISFAYSDSIPSGMTVSQLLSELKSSLGDVSPSGLKVVSSEIKTIDGVEVAYLEHITEISDEVLDSMVEMGVISEEMIEMSGGREVLTSIPATRQVSIGRIIGEKSYTFTGTYYDDSDKQVVIDAVVGILQDLKVN